MFVLQSVITICRRWESLCCVKCLSVLLSVTTICRRGESLCCVKCLSVLLSGVMICRRGESLCCVGQIAYLPVLDHDSRWEMKCVCCVEQVVNLAVLNHDGWRVTPGVCCAAFLINILPQISYIGIFMNILSLRICDFLSQPASPNQSLKSVIFSLFFQTLWSFSCSARHSYLLLVLPDYRIINTLENLLLFFFSFFFS